MSMHFFNNAKIKKGLNSVKMKRVTLPEDDRESRKRVVITEKTLGPDTDLGLVGEAKTKPFLTPTLDFLPCWISSGGFEQRRQGSGESWKNLACGIDINVAEGGAGGRADY